jgi:hypothetical protein
LLKDIGDDVFYPQKLMSANDQTISFINILGNQLNLTANKINQNYNSFKHLLNQALKIHIYSLITLERQEFC